MKAPNQFVLALGATVTLLLAGSAVAAPQSACFWVRNVENFASVDPTTVYVRASGRQVYELKLFAPCLDVDWSH